MRLPIALAIAMTSTSRKIPMPWSTRNILLLILSLFFAIFFPSLGIETEYFLFTA